MSTPSTPLSLLLPEGIALTRSPDEISSSSSSIRELVGFSDLRALDSSPEAVRAKFKEMFENVTPDGVCVNSETAFNSVVPAITKQYNYPCYKVCGEAQFDRQTTSPPKPAIIGSHYAVNRSDQEATVSLTVTGSWTRTTSWSFAVQTGIKIAAKTTITKIFELSGEVSVSTTIGDGGSESETQSISAGVQVKLPPRSKQKIDLVAIMRMEKVRFTIPVQIDGYFGANFPRRVRRHYFWFLHANEVLPRLNGDWKGELSSTAAYDVHTEIGRVEPLKEGEEAAEAAALEQAEEKAG